MTLSMLRFGPHAPMWARIEVVVDYIWRGPRTRRQVADHLGWSSATVERVLAECAQLGSLQIVDFVQGPRGRPAAVWDLA